jgi:SAM-dependent methyltransferase
MVQHSFVVSFYCNVCGAENNVEHFAGEPATCPCGSNVRVRALIHLLSTELFGQSFPLVEFPKLKAIRALGMTDKEGYARILADKFDYTNTYYGREPRFDFTESHTGIYGSYDFILSADVLEHVAPPVERVIGEICRLLKPHGFLAATVPCAPGGEMREHFPELHEYRVVPLGDSPVLINRRRDGSLEIREDLTVHGGGGDTLEMRRFGVAGVRAAALGAGFREVQFLSENVPGIGILFDADVSQPFVARKAPFVADLAVRTFLVEELRACQGKLEEERKRADTMAAQSERERERADRTALQAQLASRSRWLRLGRKLGLGPKWGRPPGPPG